MGAPLATMDGTMTTVAPRTLRLAGLVVRRATRYAAAMSALCPTPPESLVDKRGRPYFLWDVEMTLDDFRRGLASPDLDVRCYLAAKLMRQAKPDDVFQFLELKDIVAWWPGIQRYLGKSRAFWTWLLQRWESQGVVRR